MILRKINTQVRTTADTVASGAVVQFLRAGAKVSRDPGGGSIAVHHPGSTVSGDSLFVVSDGVKLAGVDVNLTSNWAYQSGTGDWTATATISGSYTPMDGDRLVGNYESGDGLTLTWADDLGTEDQQSSVTLGSSGVIERYTKDFDVDLRINNGGTITWAFDISTEPRTEVRPEDFADSRNVANGVSIQKALDYLRDIGGGVLRLGDATYSTSTTLNIQGDNISICGCGPSSVIQQTGTSTGAISTIQIDDGVDGVTLQNFKITVTGAYGTAGRGAVMVNAAGGATGCKNHRYENLTIASAGTSGIATNNLQDSIVHGCIIDNGGGITGEHGIYISDGGADSSNVVISDCLIINNGQTAGVNQIGIQIAGGTAITISGCTVSGWNNCILLNLRTNATDINVFGNHIRGAVETGSSTGNGFFSFGGGVIVTACTVIGNVIESCDDSGIRVDSPMRRSIFSSNIVRGNGEDGLNVNGLTYSSIVGNEFYDNTGFGMHFKGDVANTHLNVVGNHCWDSGAAVQTHGIGIAGDPGVTSNCVFGNNVLWPNVTADISAATAAAALNFWFNNSDESGTYGNWSWGNPTSGESTLRTDGSIRLGAAADIKFGTATPEGAVTAPVGSIFLRTDGGASTTLYVKESGSGNTGWVAK